MNPTNYLNIRKRRIYQGDKGGYFVRRDYDSKKLYSPKASYRKVGGNGDETKLKPKNRNSVPVKLRRAVRKNAGVAKGKGKGKAKKINRVPLLPGRPVVVRHPANRPVAPKKNRVPLLPSPPVVVRHPTNRPVAPKKSKRAANPNKGKFLVALKFKLRNTRNNRINENEYLSTANKKAIKSAKAPTNKEFSNYMGNKNRYTTYLENLYGYANYGEIPKVISYKNGKVSYIIDPNIKNFNGKPMFQTAKAIKNNLKSHRMGLANGTWAAGPGSHGVFPVKLPNGTNAELGVVNYNKINVKRL